MEPQDTPTPFERLTKIGFQLEDKEVKNEQIIKKMISNSVQSGKTSESSFQRIQKTKEKLQQKIQIKRELLQQTVNEYNQCFKDKIKIVHQVKHQQISKDQGKSLEAQLRAGCEKKLQARFEQDPIFNEIQADQMMWEEVDFSAITPLQKTPEVAPQTSEDGLNVLFWGMAVIILVGGITWWVKRKKDAPPITSEDPSSVNKYVVGALMLTLPATGWASWECYPNETNPPTDIAGFQADNPASGTIVENVSCANLETGEFKVLPQEIRLENTGDSQTLTVEPETDVSVTFTTPKAYIDRVPPVIPPMSLVYEGGGEVSDLSPYQKSHTPLSLQVTDQAVNLAFISARPEGTVQAVVRSLSDTRRAFVNFAAEAVNLNQDSIFTKAGSYVVEVRATDEAGNTEESGEIFIDLFPGNADQKKSSILIMGNSVTQDPHCEIASGGIAANGIDACELKLLLVDGFGNPLYGHYPSCDDLFFDEKSQIESFDKYADYPGELGGASICLSARLMAESCTRPGEYNSEFHAPIFSAQSCGFEASFSPKRGSKYMFRTTRQGTIRVKAQNMGRIGTNLEHEKKLGLYNVIENDSAFFDGLRFVEGRDEEGRLYDAGIMRTKESTHVFNFYSGMNEGDVRIKLVALAPSGVTKEGKIGASDNAYIFQPQGERVPFEVKVRNVDWRNFPEESVTSIELVPAAENGMNRILFEPAIKTEIKSTGAGEPENSYETEEGAQLDFIIGAAQKLWGEVWSESVDFLIPEGLKMSFRGHAPKEPDAFVFEKLAIETLNNGEGAIVTYKGGAVGPQNKNIETTLRTPAKSYKTPHLAFTSKVEYPLVDPAGGQKTVLHPGRNLGNRVTTPDGKTAPFFSDCKDLPDACDNTSVKGLTLGVDIEGQILTLGSNFSFEKDESTIVEMGDTHFKDARELITQNAYEMIRGEVPQEGTQVGKARFDVQQFEDRGVTYFKDTNVHLGTPESVSFIGGGRHTLVIEDGNLVIEGDLVYEQLESSLGVILINTNPEAKLMQGSLRPVSETGNIFIYREVKYFVGTYFADGGLISTDDLNRPVTTTDQDLKKSPEYREDHSPESLWRNQLILEGTVLSRNTLGGAVKWGENGDRINPWGIEKEKLAAQRYDLNFVRRYYPPTPKKDRKTRKMIPALPDIRCTPKDPTRRVDKEQNPCDNNKHSFVIRPDQRVQLLPPPGFKH